MSQNPKPPENPLNPDSDNHRQRIVFNPCNPLIRGNPRFRQAFDVEGRLPDEYEKRRGI